MNVKRLRPLIKNLRKNGQSKAKKGKNGGSSISSYVIPLILILLSCAAGWFVSEGQYKDLFSKETIMAVLVTIVLFVVAIMSAVKVVTSMFFEEDLTVLLSLPFNKLEISLAKIILVIERQYAIASAIVIPFTVMYSIFVGFDFMFCMAMVITIFVIPAIVVGIIGSIIMFLLRFISFIRNKNLLKIIGIVLGSIVFGSVYIPLVISGEDSANMFMGIVNAIVESFEMISEVNPISVLLIDFVNNGYWLAIPILLGISIIVVGIVVILANSMYVGVAFAIHDGAIYRKSLDEREFDRILNKNSKDKALVKIEFKRITQNSELLVKLVLMPLIIAIAISVMLLFSVITVISNNDAFDPAIIVFVMVPLCTCLPFSGLSVACTALSRDGKTFDIINRLPISKLDILKSKKKIAMILGVAFSTVPIFAVTVVCTIIGKMPWYGIILGLAINIPFLIIIIEYLILSDMKHPNFMWNDINGMKKDTIAEKMVTVSGIIWMVVMILAVVGISVLCSSFFEEGFIWGNFILYGLTVLVLALVAKSKNKNYYKKGQEYIKQLYIL